MKKNDFKIIINYLKNDKLMVGIYIFLVIICSLPEAFSPLVWGLSLETLILKKFQLFLIYLISYEIILILCNSIFQNLKQRVYTYLEIKFTKNVTKDLYKKIDCLPSLAFEDIGVGEFINRLSSDTEIVMELLNSLIKLIIRCFIAIVAVAVAFKVSFILGIEIIIFAIIMGVTANIYFPKIKKIQKNIKKESDKYVREATENITGIREIKSLGIKHNVEKDLFKKIDNLFLHSKESSIASANYYAINNCMYFVLEFAIIATCGYLFVQGEIAYSIFIMMQTYIWRIDYVVESMSDFGVNYNKVSVSLNRINEILENRLYNDESFGNVNLKKCTGNIEFKNVKFKYREDENYTLNGLSMKIESHKKIAIVGKSGNGKSTIFNLLLRYFDSNKGEILIDDINIKELTESSLRKNISVIRQSPFLFNLSILDNFKLVKKNVSLDEVKKVCKKAYIDKYIESLPNGYNTIIGEGGINLSGGQKQRLAIARTLLLNTKIILFDEATSALDNESQEYIKKTIDNLVSDHTVIIVAHRLSTIIDADIIHVIENGKLKDSGTHEYLIKNSKTYSKLYQTEYLNQL